MKLVFIIINKSPITLNWVINLAGKSNTTVRVFPFPEGALQRKKAASSRSRGWQCSLRQLLLCCPSIYSGHKQLVALPMESVYLSPVPEDIAQRWASACIVSLAKAYFEVWSCVLSMCQDCAREDDAILILPEDTSGVHSPVRKACV